MQLLNKIEDAVDNEVAKQEEEFHEKRLLELRRSDEAKNELFDDMRKRAVEVDANQMTMIEDGEKKVFEEMERYKNVQGTITKEKRKRIASKRQGIICQSPVASRALALDAPGAFDLTPHAIEPADPP
jgi:hypothetical protein